MRPPLLFAVLLLSASPGWAQPGSAVPAPAAAAWQAFVAAEPGEWLARFDGAATPLTLRPRHPAPLPGWERDHAGALRAFFDRHRALFGLAEGDEFAALEEREHAGVAHVRLRQRHRGLPVLGGEYMASVGRDGRLQLLAGRAWPVPELALRPGLSARRAELLARAGLPPPREPVAARSELAIAPREGSAALVWAVTLAGADTPYEWRVLVDAHSGAVLERTDLVLRDGYTGVGRGTVAYPSPERGLLDTTLVHLRDDVTLLEGRYVTALSQQVEPVSRPDGRYYFQPCSTGAEPWPNPYDEVSVYWQTDGYLTGFLGALGYTWTGPPLRAHVHEPSTNLGLAFSTSAGTFFTQNAALACCAEDADIVIHETTHSVLRGFGIDGSGVNGKNLEPLAMHEGFADYFAAAATDDPYIGEFTFQHRPPGYGIERYIDNDPVEYNYARYDSLAIQCALTASAHCRGLIWSGALWDLRDSLPEVATRLVLESIHYLPAVPCFAMGYDALWAADFDLHGGADVALIDRVFARRGIHTSGLMLGGSIVGPTVLALGEPGTFTVTGVRGTLPFHYVWSQFLPGIGAPSGLWVPLEGDAPQVTASSTNTTSFTVKCVYTEAGGHWGEQSLAVSVTVPPLSVRVRPAIAVPYGGCARDTAIVSGGMPPLTYAWWRLTPYNLVSSQAAVADSPVTFDHGLRVQVRDRMSSQVFGDVSVTVPYGRPTAYIRGPGALCCDQSPDSFVAVVQRGRPPYRYSWEQVAAGSPSGWTSTAPFLAGSDIRRDSSFTLRLAVTDADGVAAETVVRPVGFCRADSCRWDGGEISPDGRLRLLVASPLHVSAAPLSVVVQIADNVPARLDVLDLNGRRLADLGGERLRLGLNELRWDCRGTRPGIYFVRLASGRTTIVRKVALLP